MEPLLRGHLDETPTPLERSTDNVNLNINIPITTPDEGPTLLKGHISGANLIASQEGFQLNNLHHCEMKVVSISKSLS